MPPDRCPTPEGPSVHAAWLLVAALLLGCGQAKGPLDTATDHEPLDADHRATLSFTPDMNALVQDPPIVAGGEVRVLFHQDRLPDCRATVGGLPAWGIDLGILGPEGPTVVPMTQSGQWMTATVRVPDGVDALELWFHAHDRAGCSQYDSRGGANYRFQVSRPQEAATIRFTPGWDEIVTDGPIEQGGLVRIDYSPERLRTCRATYDGGRTWNIVASWVFHPGGQTGSVPLYVGDYFAGEAAIRQPELPVPEDATELEVWFSNSDRAGCVAWDSDFGANYHFPVVPRGGGAIGWVGDPDFVIFHRPPARHLGDVDPIYHWDSWLGAETTSRLEIQVWAPGITDRDVAPGQDTGILAQAVLQGLDEPVDLKYLGRRGNNQVYGFEPGRLRTSIYLDPPLPDGLYHFYLRFSADHGRTWTRFPAEGEPPRRLVVAASQTCDLFPDHPPEGCPRELEVGWAGAWGRYTGHRCSHEDHLDDPVVVTKSAVGHDCMGITARVWVPGLTDAGGEPGQILAQVETTAGFGAGGPLAEPIYVPLTFDGREGNDFRYVWWLGEHVGRVDRGDYTFRFRFSADHGRNWTYVGLGDGADARHLHVRHDSSDLDDGECREIVRWAGATSYFDGCLPYRVAEDHDARFCELYVDALGRGEMSHNGAWARWIEAYVRVAPDQRGRALGVGMWVSYTDHGEPGQAWAMGSEIEPGLWLTGFTHGQNAAMGVPGASPLEREIVEFAFFLDVRGDDGQVTRLWQSRGGRNYDMDGCFRVPGYEHGIGVGTIEYADGSVDLFDQKRACQ